MGEAIEGLDWHAVAKEHGVGNLIYEDPFPEPFQTELGPFDEPFPLSDDEGCEDDLDAPQESPADSPEEIERLKTHIPCPRRGGFDVVRRTHAGTKLDPYNRCKSNSCGACAPRIVMSIKEGINLYPVGQWGSVRLADRVEDLESGAGSLRGSVRAMLNKAKRKYGVGAIHVVTIDSAHQPLARVATRGGRVPDAEWEEWANELGLGVAGLEQAPGVRQVTSDMFKLPLSAFGASSDEEAAELMALWLQLNGGKLYSIVAPFWCDEGGRPVRGAAGAKRRARDLRYMGWL